MRAFGAVCVALWGASLTLAGVPASVLNDALPEFAPAGREIDQCPDNGITGQSPGMCGTTQWFFYSDLEFASGTLHGRLRADNFPPAGLLDPNDPNQWIGHITWYGVYVDTNSNQCTKPQDRFRIRFYDDNDGDLDPNDWVYEEHVIATPWWWTTCVIWPGFPPFRLYRFDATLTTPVQMAKGWISIVGEGSPGCHFLWEGSNEGDDRFAAWWESNVPGTLSYPTTFCDLSFCFGVKVVGACCNDRYATCVEGVTELECNASGGRFRANQPCSSFGSDPNDPNDYLCGEAPGACCFSNGMCIILPAPVCFQGGPPPLCPGDADCDGDRDFGDINPFVAALAGEPPCIFENLDVNGDGSIDFDDIDPFVNNLGQTCADSDMPLWLGAFSTCDQCCVLDCNDPNHPVTHQEEEPCGTHTNDGCSELADPNDPNSPVDPNGWEHLGVLDPNTPTVICGTLWADNGTRDTDWYDFQLPVHGTLSWVAETENIPLISTPVYGDGDLERPTIPANCHGGPLWGYWNFGPAFPCLPSHAAPADIFPAGETYWWIVLPDNGSPIFYGYPCALSEYRITITCTPLTCDPCLPTDRPEAEPGCDPNYVDTFNSGCDSTDGNFHVQATIDPNYFYCGRSGTWTDPNGTSVVDADWWRIVLTGTVRKRLQIQMRSAFDMRWELYSVPQNDCANGVRLDYYEFDACDANVSVYTTCLNAGGAAYYLRMVPRDATSCTQYNTYRFQYSVVSEAPACSACSVSCTTSIDDACQAGPNDPETNPGCIGEMPPGAFMAFTAGDNAYGPKYCGRLSTFTGSDGTPRADLDWFHFDQPAGRAKLVIRAKAKFRMSINIGTSCTDPNSITHGWDRPCKGATTAATQIYQPMTPLTQYVGVILYGNGGGDGANEEPLRQFFFGLPCSDIRSEYELELKAQT